VEHGISADPMSRGWRRFGVTLGVIAALLVGACWVVNTRIVEFYSRGWTAASTENARLKGVFVASPVIEPARTAVTDSIDLHVTDAWVERPTRVEYRWYVWPRTIQDSSYRLVLHYVPAPHYGGQSGVPNGRCFASFDILLDGVRVGRSGNASVQIATVLSRTAFPDTIHLSVDRLGTGGTNCHAVG
jgi:hypothetical protein